MNKIIVFHAEYGCDTGCCGHVVRMIGGREKFNFDHPYSDDKTKYRAFAEDLVREVFGDEHVADLDWENCVIIDD